MKRITLSLVFLSFLSLITFSQADPKEAARLQKNLKKTLLKDTMNVYDVDFSGCEASIKVSFRSPDFSASTSSAAAFGMGGFPTDTESSHGTAPPILSSFRYLIDLSKIGVTNLSVVNGWRKGTSIVRISDGLSSGTIRTIKKGRIDQTDSVVFTIKTKNVGKVLDVFKSLARVCSE